MKKKRFTETQIFSILKEFDAGKNLQDISREQGVSKATIYNWKAKVRWHGEDYNYERPHDSLGGRSPADMLAVDSWKTRNEFPTNPQPVTTIISEMKLSNLNWS